MRDVCGMSERESAAFDAPSLQEMVAFACANPDSSGADVWSDDPYRVHMARAIAAYSSAPRALLCRIEEELLRPPPPEEPAHICQERMVGLYHDHGRNTWTVESRCREPGHEGTRWRRFQTTENELPTWTGEPTT